MRVAKIEKNSVANGPGVRLVIWCQGCSVHCKGCQNPETWDPFGGREFTGEDLEEIIEYLNHSYVSGVTFSGGHPLERYNIDYVICTIQEIRKRCPSKTVWLYTGWTLDYMDISDLSSKIAQCVGMCDVVVDGPYIEEQRNISLPYCGSSNQRVIDIKKTLENERIMLYETLY